MNFDELNATIPLAVGGKQKVLSMNHPENENITFLMPGRHSHETTPVGGDFAVVVNYLVKDGGQFTHIDIFQDLEKKAGYSKVHTELLMKEYLSIVQGGSLRPFTSLAGSFSFVGIEPFDFLAAVQALAVAEHRRYSQHEAKFGGRYLPFRYGTGIVEGLWTAADAAEKAKRGRLGVEWLERDFGVPILTKELMQ